MGESVPVIDFVEESVPRSVLEVEEENLHSERRVSLRNLGRKRPYYGSPQKIWSNTTISDKHTSTTIKRKIKFVCSSHKSNSELIHLSQEQGISEPIEGVVEGVGEGALRCSIAADLGDEQMVSCSNAADLGSKDPHQRMKETIRLFTKHYLQFVQVEEQRCKKVDTNVKTTPKGAKSKKGNSREEDARRSAKRPDLKAITKVLMLGIDSFREQKWLLWVFIAIGYVVLIIWVKPTTKWRRTSTMYSHLPCQLYYLESMKMI